MLITKSFSQIFRKTDPVTEARIQAIEEVPLAQPEALEGVSRAMYRDLPKNCRPPKDATKYYKFSGGAFIISSYDKRKIINCIVDNKCVNDGKTVKLFPNEL